MSIIKQPLLFVGSKGETMLYTLFDSGANLSCINLGHVSALTEAATMQKWRIKLNFEYDTVEVDPKVAKMQLI